MRNDLLSVHSSKDLSHKIVGFHPNQLILDSIKQNSTKLVNIHLVVHTYHGFLVKTPDIF